MGRQGAVDGKHIDPGIAYTVHACRGVVLELDGVGAAAAGGVAGAADVLEGGDEVALAVRGGVLGRVEAECLGGSWGGEGTAVAGVVAEEGVFGDFVEVGGFSEVLARGTRL